MDWQQLAALLLVAAAGAGLLWAKLRRRKFSFARETHCGCGDAAAERPGASIVFRARKGQRSEVRVKMK
jgi:hypothetical protein